MQAIPHTSSHQSTTAGQRLKAQRTHRHLAVTLRPDHGDIHQWFQLSWEDYGTRKLHSYCDTHTHGGEHREGCGASGYGGHGIVLLVNRGVKRATTVLMASQIE